MANNPKLVAQIAKFLKNCKGFERVMKSVNIVSAGDGECLAEYKVEEDVTNVVGTMHGGYSATLVDTITSYALYSNEKSAVPSVSVDLHLTYLKAANLDDEIIIEAKTIRAGKSLGYLSCEIRNKNTGDILVNGLHTKYLLRDK